MAVLTLEISNELEQKLQLRAKDQGLDIAKVALGIIQEELYDPATTTNPNDLPYEVWRERFEAWIKSHPKIDVVLDDSRETIYEGR
jgi:hypothetical protein